MKSLVVVIVALVALAGCSSPAVAPAPTASAGSPSPSQATTTAAAPKPLDLSGKWKQTNSKSADSWQVVSIMKDTMEIQWVSDNGDTKSVYWVGTFIGPKTTEDSYDWTSKRDRKRTDNAILASTAKTKGFSYSNGVLSYEVSALGTTVTVRAERD